MESTIQVTCFAGLQKFFQSQVTLNFKLPVAYENVLEEMKKINPEAIEILDSCRIAVCESFVSRKALMTSDEPIFIIPPSSGG
ncbi:ubiquitin family protein [Mangrovibacterium lignilyticum]|uniref:MoaD/ThiS family protein n=1 Tax=Mangrovibacterium lignilyticum TaxID=2668052 RepID=UPI0013D469E5|nr:MoaD/ThiS family protein [Mangrovibacterium lignilyticum]